MMRLAHEVAWDNFIVVYFSVMLPDQILRNSDVLSYFESVHFLCLNCPPDVLRARLAGRVESGSDTQRIEVAVDRWARFNDVLTDAARTTDVCSTRPPVPSANEALPVQLLRRRPRTGHCASSGEDVGGRS